MADYLTGLSLIDLDTRDVVEVAAPQNGTLLGIEGIYAIKDGLIAVQNGITPNRIIRLKLCSD